MTKYVYITTIFTLLIALGGCSTIEKPSYGISDDVLNNEASGVAIIDTENKDIVQIKASVESIYDGDTMLVSLKNSNILPANHYIRNIKKPINIRLLGIDTPELSKETQLYGEEARVFLRELVEDREITLVFDPKANVDKYDRYLVHAFVDDVNIQEQLLMNGLARTAYIFDDYLYLDEYKQAESIARNQDLNIWSIVGYATSQGFNMNVVKGRDMPLTPTVTESDINTLKTSVNFLIDFISEKSGVVSE
ncbi:thermonuclease family protein [Metabacillus herbersteinensis]|uniref:Thermonuclease family protein n=1 Tax=Metabacillus herbersteinensis TaxID=283816 RepID=A0ABV6GIU5_9BACI